MLEPITFCVTGEEPGTRAGAGGGEEEQTGGQGQGSCCQQKGSTG